MLSGEEARLRSALIQVDQRQRNRRFRLRQRYCEQRVEVIAFFGMAGLGVTIWPYVIPPDVTIWDAAAPERSQIFMLVGVAITMPLIIAYTAWAYYVFRGKVGHEGYH